MKILIVNYYDEKGGAAIAARRHCEALLSQGMDVQLLVGVKTSAEEWVISLSDKISKAKYTAAIELDQFYTNYFYPNKDHTYFTNSKFPINDIIKRINQINPDIVHLHWVSGNLFQISKLHLINSPIVWSFHDMWAFTGGCHYNGDCQKFKDTCGNCKALHSNKTKDLSRTNYNNKAKPYQKKDFTAIGLSNWMANEAKESSLLKGKKIIHLPNCIDISKFKRHNENFCRNIWNLPEDKFLILFGAMNATSDPRKGFNHLKNAISNLDKDKYELVVFGASSSDSQMFGLKAHFVGKVNDERALITLYSSVNVFVLPSVQENLSNTVLESMSCGTPVVAFKIGGNEDMISHRQDGYLAKPFDTLDLANGIRWCVNHTEQLTKEARLKVENNFSYQKVAKKYKALYQSIVLEK